MTVKIILAGPRGKMGSTFLKVVQQEENFELVACIDRKHNGKRLWEIHPSSHLDVPIYEDAQTCFQENPADVFVDLTMPDVGFEHTKKALNNGIRTVTGTSGFTSQQIDELTALANKNQVGCIIAPNFAIGAVLMMQFAQMAAEFFPNVEIIEKHHDQKIDAPSGTAMKTVDMIKEVRQAQQQGHPGEFETLPHARGGEVEGIRIHSVRLPGLIAHQEVIFGAPGQTLTITHDSFSRESFMEGIKLAVNEVMNLEKLVYGLENILNSR